MLFRSSIRSDLIQGDGDALAGTINAQALAPIVDWYFGSGHRCLVAWDTASSSDRNAEAASISGAANAIRSANEALAGSGLRIDVREVATRFHVPVVEDAPTAPSAVAALPAAPAPPQPAADNPTDGGADAGDGSNNAADAERTIISVYRTGRRLAA